MGFIVELVEGGPSNYRDWRRQRQPRCWHPARGRRRHHPRHGQPRHGQRCLTGSSNALAVGKGDDVVPATGGGILGTRSGSGRDHVVIHDVPARGAFTTAAPPLCAHKESCWSFTLLPGRCSTSDLTHYQRSCWTIE
jgi:hypothetical protein